MIRYIKKFNFLESKNAKIFKETNFKKKFFLKFQQIKLKMYSGTVKETPKMSLNFNQEKVSKDNFIMTEEFKLKNSFPEKKIFTQTKNETSENDKKFLKKKLKRKLGRLKRKIKRYKVNSNESVYSKKINLNMTESDDKINQLNLKIKDMQNELGKIHESEDKNSQDVIKVKNKYKRKIKKLRNKINKLNKNIEKSNNIVELKTVQLNTDSEIKKDIQIEHTNSEFVKGLEEQLDLYKIKNQELQNQIESQNLINNSKTDEKNKIEELELKVKHYQEENIRLSNLVTSQNKKIEIMSSQIQNFENLKNKLYEQVNILGDTLLDNDNVENIFENHSSKNDQQETQEENLKEIKVVNSNNESINLDYTPNKINKNLVVNDNYLDKEISKIFSE